MSNSKEKQKYLIRSPEPAQERKGWLHVFRVGVMPPCRLLSLSPEDDGSRTEINERNYPTLRTLAFGAHPIIFLSLFLHQVTTISKKVKRKKPAYPLFFPPPCLGLGGPRCHLWLQLLYFQLAAKVSLTQTNQTFFFIESAPAGLV